MTNDAQMSPSERGRREWMSALATLVSPAFPVPATAALCKYLPFLDDYPDAVFSVACLKHVAKAPRRQSVPSYDELIAALSEFMPAPSLAKDDLRRSWLTRLAIITSPGFQADAIKALMTYLPLDDFPDEAFTEESAFAVSDAPRKQSAPARDELCRALSAWWREHRPRLPALVAPEKPPEPEWQPPTEEERAKVAATLAAFQAELAGRAQQAGVPRRRAEPSAPQRVIDVLEQPSNDPEVQAARAALAQRRATRA